MSNFIYKYRLPFKEVSEVVLPKHARVIRVDGLDGALWIWAQVDTKQPLEVRTFYLFKTGSEMPSDIDSYIYLGCGAIHIQMELMMYVYERPCTGVPYVDNSAKVNIAEHYES